VIHLFHDLRLEQPVDDGVLASGDVDSFDELVVVEGDGSGGHWQG